MPFLRGTTPIWGTQNLPGRFKDVRRAKVPPMGAINTLPLYNYTEGSPSPFRQSRVVRFPCGREENMAMYHYTKSTRSQSLTVVESTISDLRA